MVFCMEKTTRYNGKPLRFVHSPDEGFQFNTDDFFNILGVNPDFYITDNEHEFISYSSAFGHADRMDEVFAQWLKDNYGD